MARGVIGSPCSPARCHVNAGGGGGGKRYVEVATDSCIKMQVDTRWRCAITRISTGIAVPGWPDRVLTGVIHFRVINMHKLSG